MIVTVRLLAFREGDLRSVQIPDALDRVKHVGPDAEAGKINFILERVFFYGQNDHQPQELPSVSMGDVAELWGKHYLCCSWGWKELSEQEYQDYLKLTREQRMGVYMSLSSLAE
jgi:hypothetical protein